MTCMQISIYLLTNTLVLKFMMQSHCRWECGWHGQNRPESHLQGHFPVASLDLATPNNFQINWTINLQIRSFLYGGLSHVSEIVGEINWGNKIKYCSRFFLVAKSWVCGKCRRLVKWQIVLHSTITRLVTGITLITFVWPSIWFMKYVVTNTFNVIFRNNGLVWLDPLQSVTVSNLF